MSAVLPDPPSTPWGARWDFQDFFSYITAISSSLNSVAGTAASRTSAWIFGRKKKGNSELFLSLPRDPTLPAKRECGDGC